MGGQLCGTICVCMGWLSWLSIHYLPPSRLSGGLSKSSRLSITNSGLPFTGAVSCRWLGGIWWLWSLCQCLGGWLSGAMWWGWGAGYRSIGSVWCSMG